MTYVSCYYHAFQGAQQVPEPIIQQKHTQVPYQTYQQPYQQPYYNNRDNVTKSFHPHSTTKNKYTNSIRQRSDEKKKTDIQNSTQRHIQEKLFNAKPNSNGHSYSFSELIF